MKDSKSRVAELLGREEQSVLSDGARKLYKNKTVLITGGGGTIGSELARILATLSPMKIIVFDIYENNAYDLSMELHHKYGESLDLVVEIGSVRDRDRLEEIFSTYKPEIVFHAAAHKHVPLMEEAPGEAVKNNILGTENAADYQPQQSGSQPVPLFLFPERAYFLHLYVFHLCLPFASS